MATYIDSSIYLSKEKSVGITAPTISPILTNEIEEPLFSANSQNTTPTETTEQTKTRKIQIRNINKKELVKKYKDNPMGVIQELGLELNEEELKELQALLTDKKSLEQFLNIVDKKSLTPSDLIGALDHELKRKGSWFGKRWWTRITKGRSEHEIKADEFSREMGEIREARNDFSTESVVNIADANEAAPENKENVMHFVEAKTPTGTAVYSEENVTDAVAFIQERPQDAEEFVSITTELESITDEHGVAKYTGTTMLNVGKRSIENPKLKETNLKAAHKKDMTDEFLENITKNLFENPEMQGVIDFSLGAKNKDGSDKFSAGNINDESNQLVTKDGTFCNSYLENLKTLSSYGNLTSDDIVKITENITSHPEIYNDVIAKLESGTMSSSEIAEYSAQCARAAENNEYVSNTSIATTNGTVSFATGSNYNENTKEISQNKQTETLRKIAQNKLYNKNFEHALNISEITDEEQIDSSNTVEIRGKFYPKDKLQYALYTQFGTISDKLMKRIIADPDFIDVLKQYGGNRIIIEAMLNNPDLITKINSAAGALSNKERAEIIELCTDTGSINVMLAALETGSVSDAIRTTKNAKVTNSKDDTLAILKSNNKNNSSKKQELRQLYGINDKHDYIC